MNNFNIVLAAIKKQSALADSPSIDCFECVQSELEDSCREYIDLYLDFLQDLGLIKYNVADKVITLTELGKSTKIIFK